MQQEDLQTSGGVVEIVVSVVVKGCSVLAEGVPEVVPVFMLELEDTSGALVVLCGNPVEVTPDDTFGVLLVLDSGPEGAVVDGRGDEAVMGEDGDVVFEGVGVNFSFVDTSEVTVVLGPELCILVSVVVTGEKAVVDVTPGVCGAEDVTPGVCGAEDVTPRVLVIGLLEVTDSVADVLECGRLVVVITSHPRSSMQNPSLIDEANTRGITLTNLALT